MRFPVISPETRQLAEAEIDDSPDQEARIILFFIVKLERSNPFLGRFLRILSVAREMPEEYRLATLRGVYVILRSLELTMGALPYINEEISAPLSEMLQRSSRQFLDDMLKRVREENKEVREILRNLRDNYSDSDDGAQVIVKAGLLVYSYVSVQWEVDLLNEQAALQGSC